MQTKHLCVLIHLWTKGEVGAPLSRLKPSSKIFNWPFQRGTSFVDLFCFFFCLNCLLCICMRLFICAMWSPAGKELTSWVSFVVSSCEFFFIFPLVSWVMCGTWLYRFLIFAPLLTSLSYRWSLRHLFYLFLSGRFIQFFLYLPLQSQVMRS